MPLFSPDQSAARPAGTFASLREGPLGALLATGAALHVDIAGHAAAASGSQPLIVADNRLQDMADYRVALQAWFAALAVGGQLVIVVPHSFLFERQDELPSRWRRQQKRLYTPGSLVEEVEEALAPNSYRIRWLGDRDEGYDYALDPAVRPVGEHGIVLLLERIAPPAWGLSERTAPVLDAPDYSFREDRTRRETASLAARERILILKLDHLGDFIMGIPALERARAAWPDAEITLVVGSWNERMARDLGLADHVLAFDVYPRNSSEEAVDVPGKKALFDRLVTGEYDIAIDLRTDPDTRFLLRDVRARLRCGMGRRIDFPFLDIFLPIDFTRHEPETARETAINHHAFASQPFCERNDFRIWCEPEKVRHDVGALTWGPYHMLRPGNYIWEPRIEITGDRPGILSVDVAIDAQWVAFAMLPSADPVRLRFRVETANARFESRIWAVEGEPAPAFSFYGGRLLREGADSVLHQSEYQRLLIELVAMRTETFGVLHEAQAIA